MHSPRKVSLAWLRDRETSRLKTVGLQPSTIRNTIAGLHRKACGLWLQGTTNSHEDARKGRQDQGSPDYDVLKLLSNRVYEFAKLEWQQPQHTGQTANVQPLPNLSLLFEGQEGCDGPATAKIDMTRLFVLSPTG